MNRPKYQLGSFNQKKVYYLYPHFSSYFSHLYSQFQQIDWESNSHLLLIAEVIKSIVYDIQSANLKYLEELVVVISKLQQLQPDKWEYFTSLVPSLRKQSIQKITNHQAVQISSTFYAQFGGLSLGKYLQGLTIENVVVLNLSKMRMIDGNIDKLSRLKIPTLNTLIVQSNEITGEGIKMIVNHSDWKFLHKLNLSRNNLNNEAIRTLCKSNWRYLKELQLQGNPFGDAGVDFLCRYGKFPFLESLDLRTKQHDLTAIFPTSKNQYWYCELTYKSVQSILQSNWKNLSNLKIRLNNIEIDCKRSSEIKNQLISVL